MIFWRDLKLPNLNPRVVGDLPYPNRMAISNAPLNVGGVTNIDINVPGINYKVGDELIIDAPPVGGIQAKAVVTLVKLTAPEGEILAIEITDPGAGYTGAPAVTIGPSGTGATFNGVTVSTIIPITFGLIYTTDTAGRLIVPVAASSSAILTKGVLQAQATTFDGDGNTRVQVATPPSRIILKADAGLKKNDMVQLFTPTPTTTNQEKVKAGSVIYDTGHLGRIFEIETHNADGSVKEVTIDNDLVVIDLGVSQ